MHHTIEVHPGEVLRDELEERNISQTALASHLRVSPRTINDICRGRRGLTAIMALKLSQALGASPQFWLNLQTNWDLSRAKKRGKQRIKPIAA